MKFVVCFVHILSASDVLVAKRLFSKLRFLGAINRQTVKGWISRRNTSDADTVAFSLVL